MSIYKLTSFAKTRRPLPGVAWRDLSDEEYKAACERHPGMEEQGYFEKVDEPKKARTVTTPDSTVGNVDVFNAKEETNG